MSGAEQSQQAGYGRTPLVAGNWKMHYGPAEAIAFVKRILPALEPLTGVERVLCPPAISLTAVHALLGDTRVELGAQNMFYEAKGAFTGEISPAMLQSLCRYVILGHSERRWVFGESDELVNRKAQAAFAYGLRPIVCVGERLEDREANLTERMLTGQAHGSLGGLPGERLGELVVAYEPVWAIGSGRPATPQDAADAIGVIRALLGQMYGREAAERVRVLYGGSVTPANAAAFAAAEVDGALVGGASLTPDFVEIVRQFGGAKGR